MLDHVTLHVADLARSARFYVAALAPLQYALVMQHAEFAGLGVAGRPDFWIAQARGAPHSGVHVAFTALDRASVDAFHRAALAAGGRDNGKPGLRSEYHPTYYGAFALDPDGNNIEAVCHAAP